MVTPTADALTAARVLKAWLEELEAEELRVDPRMLTDAADPEDAIREVDEARAILNAPDQPLASEYPDGKRARPPYTPRQVFLLAQVRYRPITHADERYAAAQAEVRAKLERHGTRGCVAQTKAGRDCRNHALPYIDRERCGNHATDDERARNRDMQAREEREFHDKLRELGILDGSF